jgi:hypothetical protein
MNNRRNPAPPAATLDINCDCKEYVIDYLAKSFPVRLMAVFTDENGNPRSEPMVDEQGQPVLCRSALAARDRMIEQLCALPPIATALDAIIERFGVDAVAEVTGRSRRLIAGRDGRQKLQSRSPRAPTSPRPRPSWTAASASWSFPMPVAPGAATMPTLPPRTRHGASISCWSLAGGRMPPSRGLVAPTAPIRLQRPLFRPVTTDVRGERRFISTIARRLDSLGALTRGQRQTGGQNLFDPADNLESIICQGSAEPLVRASVHRQTRGGRPVQVPGPDRAQGLRVLTGVWSTICRRSSAGSIASWRCRSRCKTRSSTSSSDWSRRGSMPRGRLAPSILALRRSRSKASRALRYAAAHRSASGATTHLLELEIARALKPLTLKRLGEHFGLDTARHRLMHNARSGRVDCWSRRAAISLTMARACPFRDDPPAQAQPH